MPKVLRAPAMSRCIGCYSCMLVCARSTQRTFTPSLSAIQVRTAGGLQGRFAHICRACPNAACAAVCPSGTWKAWSSGPAHPLHLLRPVHQVLPARVPGDGGGE